MLGDVTWEPLTECKELEALDGYLELCGAKRPRDLPRKPDLPGRLRQSRDQVMCKCTQSAIGQVELLFCYT